MHVLTAHDDRDDLQAGFLLARDLMLMAAEDGDEGMLRAINEARDGASRWAALYLVCALREQTKVFGRTLKPRRGWKHLLKKYADTVEEDLTATAVDDLLIRLTGGT